MSVGGVMRPRATMHGRELIAFLAMAMALTALGIDLLLPAFPDLRAEFGLEPGSTAVSAFITTYFFGLAGGQLLIGPLADRFGRQLLLRAGIVLYVIAAGLAIVAPNFTLLLVARFIWGVGAAAGRVLALAIVRDRFVGAAMARTMSLIMAVFIIVPVFAPTVGALLLRAFDWQQLVLINVVAAALVLLWTVRLEETLPLEYRRTLHVRAVGAAALRVLRDPVSGPLVIAQAVLFGGFASYLSTSEIVYREVFDREALFPVLFGGMALVMGAATVVNGRIVERIGLVRMLRIDFVGYLVGATALLVVALVTGGSPPLMVYLVVLGVLLASHAMIIPNMSARAMEPMGDIAGVASSVIGATLVGGGALIGAAIDRSYDGTVRPLANALVVSGLIVAVLLARSSRATTAAVEPPR
ncbi:MAG: multidrug effflux MFS transporter [Actinomycetota bacterium]|nr:multidrug effflux MFS transporter [Actinomycetota bacterium]